MNLWIVLCIGIIVGIGIGIGIGEAISYFYESSVSTSIAACETSHTILMRDYAAAARNPTSSNCLTAKNGLDSFVATCPDIGAPTYAGISPPCP